MRPSIACSLVMATCGALVACSDGGRDSDQTPKESGIKTGYAPSRFAFEPGTPGRAVGIHAVAALPGASLETHQVEIALLPPPTTQKIAALAAEPAPEAGGGAARSSQALCSTELGEQTTSLRTAAGRVCWISTGFNGGAVGMGSTLVGMLIIAGEGRYAVKAGSNDIYYPPDITSLAHIASVGCLLSRDEHVEVERLSGLTGVGVSLNVEIAAPIGTFAAINAGYFVGYTIFLEDGGYAPAFQYDTSLSSAAIQLTALSGISFQLRGQKESFFFHDPVMIARHDNVCAAEQSPFEAATSSEDPTDELDQVAEELLRPLIDHLADEEGYGPGANMMAGNNADAFESLGGPGTVEAGEELPPSTLDDLINRSGRALDQDLSDRALADELADNASDLRNVLPSPDLLDGLLRQAAVGVELTNEAARRREQELPYVATPLIRIDAQVGEPVTLSFTAEELATLIGASEQSVLGATLRLSASHTLSASEHVLEESVLELSFTPKTTTPLLIRARVDLSTAAGPIDDELLEVEPELALRLVIPRPGAPAIVALSAAERVAAGGAVTLNALVTDAEGNLSDQPVQVEFFDGDGRSLGAAMSAHGVATLQYVPTASAPVIERVERAELESGDEMLPGIRIVGTGFSVDAQITIDGEALGEDVRSTVLDAETILIALEPEAGAVVQVTNPEGAESNSAAVE